MISKIELQPEGKAVYDGSDWGDRVKVTLIAADGTQVDSDAFTISEEAKKDWVNAGDYTLKSSQITLKDGYVLSETVEPGTLTVSSKTVGCHWQAPFNGKLPFFNKYDLKNRITINSEEGDFHIAADGIDADLLTMELAPAPENATLYETSVTLRLPDDGNYCFSNGEKEMSLPLTITFCPEEGDEKGWQTMRTMLAYAMETEGLMKGDDSAVSIESVPDDALIVYLYTKYLSPGATAETEIRNWMKGDTKRAAFPSFILILEELRQNASDTKGEDGQTILDANSAQKVIDLMKSAKQDELLTILLSGELNVAVTDETPNGKSITALQEYFAASARGEETGRLSVPRQFVFDLVKRDGTKTKERLNAIKATLHALNPDAGEVTTAEDLYRETQALANDMYVKLVTISGDYLMDGDKVYPDGTLTEPFREVLKKAIGDLKLGVKEVKSFADPGMSDLILAVRKIYDTTIEERKPKSEDAAAPEIPQAEPVSAPPEPEDKPQAEPADQNQAEPTDQNPAEPTVQEPADSPEQKPAEPAEQKPAEPTGQEPEKEYKNPEEKKDDNPSNQNEGSSDLN